MGITKSVLLTPSMLLRKQDSRVVHQSRKNFLNLWLGQHADENLGRLFGLDLGLLYWELRLNCWVGAPC
jgi:hypothetical protein